MGDHWGQPPQDKPWYSWRRTRGKAQIVGLYGEACVRILFGLIVQARGQHRTRKSGLRTRDAKPRIVRRASEGTAVREKLNSGAVICCADAIPGMREEIVLGAVIEFITRTQLATDVETQSGNSDSN